ncbi:MAG: hypothetical protein U9Q15_02805, partial [Patescibacteria group bacterium]|nr:hypothetical protein [Patescibacteria group bacterium]
INAVGKLKFAAAQASTSALYGAIESAETSIASYLNVSINGDIVDNRIAEVYDWMSNTGAVWDGKTDGNWDFPYWNDNSYRLQRVNNVELQTRYEIDGILTWIFGEQVDPADDFAEEIDDEFSGYYNDVEVEHNAYMAGANHEPVYAEIPYFEIRNMTGSTSIFDKIHSLSYTGAVWMDIALTDTGALADIVEDAVFDHAIALPEDSETFADANFMTSSSYDTLSEVFSGVVYDASSFLSQRTEYIRDAYADLQNYTGFEDGIHDSITEVLWDYLGEEENGIAGYSFEIPETDYDREVHKGRVFQYLFREFIDDDLAEENISQENRESKTWYGSTGSVVSDSIFPGMNMSSYTYRQFEYQGAAEKLPQDITVNETRISEYAEEFSYDYQFAGSGSVSPWTGPGFGKNNIHKTMQILDALRDSPSSNLVLDSYTAVDLTTKSGLGTAFVPGVNPSNTRLMGYTSTGVDGISIADTWIDGFDASTKEWNTLEYLLELKETIPTWIVDTLQGETPSIARSYTEEDDLQESLFAAISDLRTAADMSSRTGSVLTPMLYSLNDTIVDDWVDLTLSASFIDAQVSSPVERSLISSPDAKVDNINTEDIDESIYCDEDELERLGIPETNAIGESSVDNLAACKPNTLFERIALDTIMDMEAHEAVQSTEKVYPSYDSYDTYYPSGIEYLYYTHLESRQRPEASESVYPFVTWNYETPTTRDFAQSYHIDHSLPFITTDFSQKETVAVDTTADIYMQPGQGKTIAYENIKNKKNLSLVEWKVLQPALDYTGEGELLFVSGNDTHSQDIGDVDYHLQDKQHRVLLNNNFDALIDASMGVSIGYRTQVCGNGIVEDGRAFGGIKEKCDDENTNPILTFDPTPDDDTDTWVPDYCSADCLDGTGGQEDIVYWDTQLSQFQLKANADEAVDEVFRGYYTDFAKEYREKLFFFYQWRNMSPPEKVQKIFIYGLTGNLDELFTFDVSQIVNGLLFYFLDTDDNETTPMELVPHAVAQTPYSVFPKVPFYDVAYINVVGGDHMMSIDLPEPTDAGSFSEFDQAAILRDELQAKYEEMRESPCDSEMGDLDTPAICPVPSLPESGVDPADLDYSYEEMLLDVLNGGMVFVDDQEVTGLARENIDTGNLMQQAREVDQQAKKLKDMTKMNDIELPEAEMPKKEALSYLGAGTYYGSGIDIGSFDFGELVDKSELSDVQSFLAILSGGNYGQQHENIEENFSDSILYSADSKALAVVAEINTTSSDTYFPKYFSKDAHAPFLTTFAAGNPLGDTLKHHAMDTLIVYGDPGLRMAHPQVPVRMGWDTVSIFADMKDKGYFSWAFPSMVGLDWNKE